MLLEEKGAVIQNIGSTMNQNYEQAKHLSELYEAGKMNREYDLKKQLLNREKEFKVQIKSLEERYKDQLQIKLQNIKSFQKEFKHYFLAKNQQLLALRKELVKLFQMV